MERWVWYWKQIHKYPFTTALFNKFVIFVFCGLGVLWFTGGLQTICVVGFLGSFVSMWWPYIKANRSSKRIDIKPLLNKPEIETGSESRVKVRLIFDKRKRLERLTYTIDLIFDSPLSPKEKVEAGLQQLGDEEFLIVEVGKHLSRYVQYICKKSLIELEIPLPKADTQKISQVEALIKNNKLYPGLWVHGSQLNPKVYYSRDKWENMKKKPFVIYTFYFRRKYGLAAQFGIDLLHSAHDWKESAKLTAEVGTFNKGWWHNL